MEQILRVGFGRADITPEEYVELSGFGTDSMRLCNKILDRVRGTCVAISDENDNTILLCSTDLLNAKEDTVVATAREAITAATGVPGDRIMVGAVHTHSGPATFSRSLPYTGDYLDYFGKQMAKAAKEAMEDRLPATPYVGTKRAENMTFVRHYRMNDGTLAGSGFGSNKSGYKEHLDVADDNMQLIRFVREGAKDILLVNWQSHSTFIGASQGDQGKILSADYSGPFRDHLEGLSGCKVAFYQGACGNLVPTSMVPGLSLVEKGDHIGYGRLLAERAMEGLENLRPVKGGPVMAKQRTYHGVLDHSEDHLVSEAKIVSENYYKIEEHKDRCRLVREHGFTSIYHANQVIIRSKMGDYLDIEIDALCAGDLAFATAPYEMFSSNGVYIKENSPFEMTFVLAYCNGSNSYIADKKAFGYNCYEVNSRRYGEGAAEDIVENHVQMLKELKAEQ